MEWFYSLYPGLKHLHMTLIAASVGFFIVRFAWLMVGSDLLNRKWARISPHVLDTFLLLSGALLCVAIAQYPFDAPWLTEKMMALVAYIVLGVITFKLQRGNLFRVVAFLGALGWVYYMAVLAMTKTPILLG
ncbi:SirB2 family protein [Ferrimonas balearica]|uniref:SirB2 family protein n=1 Tax=Ferrimonas balearica TaxID=44012 RepID=UPI001F299FB7|nr:SirB2 family protein [Ferrimonas balearica]MBY6017520.1 SirB2 family protein [Halomonas denitrificans]MBY6093786.1 SirB2 family protein [Ferrimonas balearica]